jgi:hypothetical protein
VGPIQARERVESFGIKNFAVGTAIATFVENGRYGNHTDGSSHAAIYIGQTADGIEVIDQWSHVVGGKRREQMAHRRVLRFKGGVGHKSDDGMPSMSSSKLLVAALLLACGSAGAATECPAFVSEASVTHALTDASVYDGPPSQLADLEPTDKGWDLTSLRDSPRPVFLVCKYRGTTASRTLEIPKGTAGCAITEHAGAIQVSCR